MPGRSCGISKRQLLSDHIASLLAAEIHRRNSPFTTLLVNTAIHLKQPLSTKQFLKIVLSPVRRVDHAVIVIVGDKHLVARIPCDFAEVLIDVVALELLLGISPRHLIVAALDSQPDDALHGQLGPRIALEWHVRSRAASLDLLVLVPRRNSGSHHGVLLLGEVLERIPECRIGCLVNHVAPVDAQGLPAVVVTNERFIEVLQHLGGLHLERLQLIV